MLEKWFMTLALSCLMALSACGGGNSPQSVVPSPITPSNTPPDIPATPGSFAFTAATYAVPQDASILIVSVSRSNGSSGAVAVNFATTNDTASAGRDYTATSGTLNWAAGDTANKTFQVSVINATPFSGVRSFRLALTAPGSGAALGSPAAATASITGSGTAGAVALSAANYAVAQMGATVTISVNRTAAAASPISVSYTTSNGTATAGRDYTAASGTLSWPSGDAATKSFTVAVSNAAPFNGSRVFTVAISNPTGGAALALPTSAPVTISGSAPAVPIGSTAAARLLTQGTFGATIATISAAAPQTYDQWFNAQAAATPSRTLTNVVGHDSQVQWVPYWWKNVVQGQDQLRQRTAWALAQIFVTSNQNNENAAFYYDLLVQNAFANYRTLLERVTLSAQMGVYLSMFRNDKANPLLGTHADQNFAREIMQLFSVGLVQLNLDGTPVLDGNGRRIPTYGYPDIEGLANALTGWASTPQNGTGEQAWLYDMDYLHPMVAYPAHHESAAKTILGGVYIPAGGTAEADLKVALDTLFNHPNVGPFIGKQLIQRMVTSNPSPAYVSRVASAFNNNGSGVRGDMLAVVRAVLTDEEATSPGLGNGYGKLREPLLKLAQLWRAFNASDANGNVDEYPITNNASALTGQAPLQSPTVFNFYQTDYQSAGPLQTAGLVVPEFQILNENTLVLTANQFEYPAYQFIDSTGAQHQGLEGYDQNTGTVNLRTAAWEQYADDPASLVDQLNAVFMLGAMPASMRTTLIDYANAVPTTDSAYRARRVVETTDLLLNSPQYAIQR